MREIIIKWVNLLGKRVVHNHETRKLKNLLAESEKILKNSEIFENTANFRKMAKIREKIVIPSLTSTAQHLWQPCSVTKEIEIDPINLDLNCCKIWFHYTDWSFEQFCWLFTVSNYRIDCRVIEQKKNTIAIKTTKLLEERKKISSCFHSNAWYFFPREFMTLENSQLSRWRMRKDFSIVVENDSSDAMIRAVFD